MVDRPQFILENDCAVLHFIRHGEAMPRDRTIEDYVDSDLARPLTPQGISQAQELGLRLGQPTFQEMLGDCQVYCSPARRAQETATNVLPCARDHITVIEPLTTAHWQGDWEAVDSLFVGDGSVHTLAELYQQATERERIACEAISTDAHRELVQALSAADPLPVVVYIFGHTHFLQALALTFAKTEELRETIMHCRLEECDDLAFGVPRQDLGVYQGKA